MDMIVYESLIEQIMEAKDFSPRHTTDKETYEEYIGRSLVNLARLEAKNRYESKRKTFLRTWRLSDEK